MAWHTEEETEPPKRLATVAERALGGAPASARHTDLCHLVEKVIEAVENRLPEPEDETDVEQVEHCGCGCRRARRKSGRVACERRAARQVHGDYERSRSRCRASRRTTGH